MVVLLVDSVREIGGAQRSFLELAAALKTRGVTVHAAIPPGALAEAMRSAGVPVHAIPAVRLHRGWHPRLLLEALRFARAVAVLARVVRTVRPDILHANGVTPALLAVHARQHCPLIWHVRDLTTRVCVVHYLARRAAGIVGISESVADHLTEIIPSYLLRKVRLIRNGIDLGHYCPGDRADARRQFGLPAEAPLVGMLAHLVPWKRHADFVRTAAAIRLARPDVRFVLAGRDLFHDHPGLRRKLDAQIAAAGLDGAVIWLRDLDDAAPLLPALDVLLHPAAGEPFGRVLCEAMAAGIPVVAANSAGPSCIVPHGVAGILVRPGSVDTFAQQTLNVLNAPETARRMGAAGRQHVVKQFDIARAAEEIHAFYAQLLDQLSRDRRRREEEELPRQRDDDE